MDTQKIIYLTNKKSGVVYAYENKPFWDSEKKQSRAKRKLIGKVDPDSGEIVPTRGRRTNRKVEVENQEISSNSPADNETMPTKNNHISKVIDILQLYMCETLAKRLLCVILLIAGLSKEYISTLIGVSQKTISKFDKEIENGYVADVLKISGGGRKRKLADVESEIIKTINDGNFQTRQQIADMVYEKYGIKVSLPAIGRLLKKTVLSG